MKDTLTERREDAILQDYSLVCYIPNHYQEMQSPITPRTHLPTGD